MRAIVTRRGLIHQEVFHDECALACREGTAAAKASDLAIFADLFDSCADEFVIGPTVGTAERCWREPVHLLSLGSGATYFTLALRTTKTS